MEPIRKKNAKQAFSLCKQSKRKINLKKCRNNFNKENRYHQNQKKDYILRFIEKTVTATMSTVESEFLSTVNDTIEASSSSGSSSSMVEEEEKFLYQQLNHQRVPLHRSLSILRGQLFVGGSTLFNSDNASNSDIDKDDWDHDNNHTSSDNSINKQEEYVRCHGWDDLSEAESTDETSWDDLPTARLVYFHPDLVTEVHFRPFTTDKEKCLLYYGCHELQKYIDAEKEEIIQLNANSK
jgi:hypothetical protein